MTQRRGLGRGLDALLGGAPTADVTAPRARGLQNIAVDRIAPNPRQPRTHFDAGALDELRSSIAEFGVLVPIIVRPAGDGFELIAGERRWRAARAAGLQTLPAIVRDAGESESLEVAIIENLQRENLDPLEEAMGFAHLIDTYGYTQERLAERLGRSRPAVANALRLLGLPDPIKALLRSGALSAGHAKALLALPPERREAAAQRAARDGLTVRAVERLAREAPAAKPPRTRAPRAHSSDDESVLERLRYRLAAHVALARRGGGGTLEIRFADDAEFMRIVDILLGETPAS